MFLSYLNLHLIYSMETGSGLDVPFGEIIVYQIFSFSFNPLTYRVIQLSICLSNSLISQTRIVWALGFRLNLIVSLLDQTWPMQFISGMLMEGDVICSLLSQMALIIVFFKYVYKVPFNIFAYLISIFNCPIILLGIEIMSEFKFLDGR